MNTIEATLVRGVEGWDALAGGGGGGGDSGGGGGSVIWEA